MAAYTYRDGLISDRLTTRFLTREDIPAWSVFFEDPDSVAYLPDYGLPNATARATQWIERQLMRYENQLYGLHALIEKSTGDFIGQCGLITQEVDGQTEIEVGYHIFKRFRGKGYAPEAAKLFIQYAFDHDQTDRVVSIIDVRNTNSQRVAEKNGLTRERTTNWNGLEVFIYRIAKQSDI